MKFAGNNYRIIRINGDSSLTYKVGLITTADAKYAGITETSNTYNYLYFSSGSYKTMSPSYFLNLSNTPYINTIYNAYLYTRAVNSNEALRPVINLNKDIYITGGNDSQSSPCEVISKAVYDAIDSN